MSSLTPEPSAPSVEPRFTVTFVLFQPRLLAAGVRLAVTIGGVLSILIVTDSEALNPAPFVAKQVSVVPPVSVSSVTASQPVDEAIPDSSSLTDQDTLTAVLCQPFPFGSVEREGRMVGGELSLVTPSITPSVAASMASISAPMSLPSVPLFWYALEEASR